jgi:hypothetical protein
VIAEPWASLIVGGAAFLLGLLIAMIGASRLSARNLAPNRTIQQIQRDVTVARQQVRERGGYEEQRAA